MFPLTQSDRGRDAARQRRCETQALPVESIRRAESDDEIGVDARDFVGSIETDPGTVRQLQDATAVGQRRGRTSVRVTATGTGRRSADDDGYPVVLKNGREFFSS